MRVRSIAALLLFAGAGCHGDPLSRSGLAGEWVETPGGHGARLEFDDKSDRFLLHGAGGDEHEHEHEKGGGGREEHEGHDHFQGTYQVENGALVLTGTWENTRKSETATAALADGTLTVKLAGGARSFRRP